MSSGNAIAFLAGLGNGYLGAEEKKERNARQAKIDAREQARHDATMGELQRQTADREALRRAAAPVAVESGEVYQPANDDEGNPMPANPTAGTYKVGARRFAVRGIAEAEAGKQNTVEGTRGRVMATLAAQGNVVGADQMRTSGLQADAAQMAMDTAKRKEVDDAYNRDLITRATDFKTLESFINESKGDGRGGSLKVRFSPTPDGRRVQVLMLGEDGSTKPTPYTFDNSVEGFQRAVGTVGMRMSAEQKLAHLQGMAKTDEERARWAAEFGIKKQNADTNEQYRRDMAANMREQRRLQAEHQAAVTAGKAQAGGPIQVDLKDMRDFEGDLDGYLKDQFPVKNGVDEKERAAINAQATAKKSLGTSLFRNNAAAGIPLTAGTVLQAMELAADRKNVRIMQINGQPHEGVVVNGQPVITSGPLQRRVQAPAQQDSWIRNAPPGSAVRPAALAQRGVGGAAPAPAPAAGAAAAIAQEGVRTEAEAKAARIQALRQRLEVDDRIKSGGPGGMGGRAVREATWPLGMGERLDLERLFEKLTGAPWAR